MSKTISKTATTPLCSTIQLKKTTIAKLIKKKLAKRESYDEIVNRLIDLHEFANKQYEPRVKVQSGKLK